MATHIQIREGTKEKLDGIKEREDHTSMDSVLKSLLYRAGEME